MVVTVAIVVGYSSGLMLLLMLFSYMNIGTTSLIYTYASTKDKSLGNSLFVVYGKSPVELTVIIYI